MKTVNAAALAIMASGQAGIVQLVRMDFAVTPVYLNTSNLDLTWDGITYKGAYGLGTISPIDDKPGAVAGLVLELISGDSGTLSLALDDADKVQGTPLTIRTAIVDLSTYQVADAPVEWVGTLDTMGIVEDGMQSGVRVSAESKAVDLMRGSPSFYSDSDQRLINPTDGFFVFVLDQVDKPIIWPQRGFFYQ